MKSWLDAKPLFLQVVMLNKKVHFKTKLGSSYFYDYQLLTLQGPIRNRNSESCQELRINLTARPRDMWPRAVQTLEIQGF